MKDFSKILKQAENLDATTRKTEIVYSSAKVLSALLSEESGSEAVTALLSEESGAEAVTALVSFIIGATADGGKINEREYLSIYPALVTAFGPGYDFYSVKHSFDGLIATKRVMRENVSTLTAALASTSEITLDDLVLLYALILTPTFGKLSLKHKAHLARLTLKPTGKASKA